MKAGSEPQANCTKFKKWNKSTNLKDYLNFTRRNKHQNGMALIALIKSLFLPDS